MFPASISSSRVLKEPETSGSAAAPVAGASACPEASAFDCEAASEAAAAAPGETPSPAFPGAAPTCGPGDGAVLGRDWKEPPSSPPPSGSIVLALRALRSTNEFAVLLTLGNLRAGPLSLGGPGPPAGQRAARRRVPRGRPPGSPAAMVLAAGCRGPGVVRWPAPGHGGPGQAGGGAEARGPSAAGIQSQRQRAGGRRLAFPSPTTGGDLSQNGPFASDGGFGGV